MGKVIVDWLPSCWSCPPARSACFLSERLAAEREANMASAYRLPEDQGSVVLVWAGEDPALHTSLVEQLKAAGIRDSRKTPGDAEVAPAAHPPPIHSEPRLRFQVAALSCEFSRARGTSV